MKQNFLAKNLAQEIQKYDQSLGRFLDNLILIMIHKYISFNEILLKLVFSLFIANQHEDARYITMLKDIIKQEIIEHESFLPFKKFMQLCLYTPTYGYYSGNNHIFGKGGDFITAPEISPLFGAAIANQIADVYDNNYDIFEFGAGSGKLALDVLKRLEELNKLPNNYFILEVSGSLKARQQDKLKQHPQLYKRCQWLSALPKKPIKAVVLANEVLDAMPVNIFRKAKKNVIEESYIGFSDKAQNKDIEKSNKNLEDNEFYNFWLPTSNLQLIEAMLDIKKPLAIGYQSEINLSIKPWLKSIYDFLSEGLVLLIDYGFPQSTYYHEDRSSGTLMCHYQHKSHPNPFINLGKQDITAHVDFTAVAEAAFNLGFDISGYTSQAAFLISNGITDLIANYSEVELFKANSAIKMLTMPQEMGELFKVIALTKNLDNSLKSFELSDQRHHL